MEVRDLAGREEVMHEVGEVLKEKREPDERPEEESRRRGDEAPLLAYEAREAGDGEVEHRLRFAPPVCVERMVAAERKAVQAVDEVRAIAALGGQRERLAQAPEARRHLGRVEPSSLLDEHLEFGPLAFVRGLERGLLHCRPAR